MTVNLNNIMVLHKHKIKIVFFVIFLFSCAQHTKTKVSLQEDLSEKIFKDTIIYMPHLTSDTAFAEFRYSNCTKKRLVIENVQTRCHCTNVIYPKEPLNPGDSGVIKTYIDLTDYSGYFSRTILVYINGLQPIILKVTGRKNIMGMTKKTNSQVL